MLVLVGLVGCGEAGVALSQEGSVDDCRDDVLFANGPLGDLRVRRVDPGSGAVRDVTAGPRDDAPVWSPDGTRVAFVEGNDAGGSAELFVVGSDGSGRRQLTALEGGSCAEGEGAAGLRVREPAWAPDGQWIVFGTTTTCGGLEGLAVVRADGTGLRPLTTDLDAADLYPRWAPTGSQIAFVRQVDRSDPESDHEVMVVNADGSGLRALTSGAFATVAEWSPDGRLIAYGDVSGPDAVVWVVAPDGSAPRQLPATGVRPAWSADGTEVAYVGFFDDQSTPGRPLYAARPDGSGLRHVTTVGTGGTGASNQMDWSPDGRTIVYHDHTANLFTVPAAGGEPRQLPLGGDWISDVSYGPGIAQRRLGPTRIETAVHVSRSHFPSAATVVLARADDYADALGGGPLAGQLDGPLLLTGQDGLHDATAAEISRLAATRAVLMGGRNALSDQVERDLEAIGVTEVVRLAGATRFDTARLAAERLGPGPVYLAQGRTGWPDAVAVSALAAFQSRPILLTERDQLPDETRRALRALSADQAVIVGGQAVVANAVAAELETEGLAVSRLAGATRYETSRAVADHAVAAGMSPASTWLAAGSNWPDSLAAGPAAARDAGVLLLVDGRDPTASPATADWLVDHGAELDRVTLVGGPDVLTPALTVLAQRASN